MARQWATIAAEIRACKPEVILKAAELCDGWTIFDPKVFLDAGLPPDFVARFDRGHRSGAGKYAISDGKGKPLDGCRGVYGLDLIEGLCDALGVEKSPCHGRGFRADGCMAALQRHFSTAQVPVKDT